MANPPVEGHSVIFSHREVNKKYGPLTVTTGANKIEWSYGLNTQSFPTYAGEVVQILSAYTDNITITGEVVSYRKMEEIYQWFLEYVSVASQGKDANDLTSGVTSYNETPVSMSYPHRGWNLKIKPLSLPALRYGRDVVVPTWTVEAAVVEDEVEMVKLANEAAQLGHFGKLTGAIGFREHNPFSDPEYAPKDVKKFLGGNQPGTIDQLTDWYNSLIPAYMEGDTSELTDPVRMGSQPASSTDSSHQDTKGQ